MRVQRFRPALVNSVYVYVKPTHNHYVLRGHGIKLAKERSRLNTRKFFSQHVVNSWNCQPAAVVNAEFVNAFKNACDRNCDSDMGVGRVRVHTVISIFNGKWKMENEQPFFIFHLQWKMKNWCSYSIFHWKWKMKCEYSFSIFHFSLTSGNLKDTTTV